MKELSLIKSVSSDIESTTDHDEVRDKEKLEKQLQAWRDNPSWIDQPPKVQVRFRARKKKTNYKNLRIGIILCFGVFL